MDHNGKCDNSQDQNSLGILSMDNLKVFGDLSSLCKSGSSSRESLNINERLKAERKRALEMLEKPNARKSNAPSKMETTKQSNKPLPVKRDSVASTVPASLIARSRGKSINISELITDETINLNSSSSFAVSMQQATNISFEPAEITGRSTLCRSDNRGNKHGISKTSTKSEKSISVADILKTSFVEKARLLEKKLINGNQQEYNYTTASSATDSFSASRSLPHTADMSQRSNITINGGAGFSFSSAAAQEFNESNFSSAAGFAPAELMESKLVSGEISWAQAYTAMPTATLSKQAMEKIAASVQAPEIESLMSNSVIAGDPDFSVGSFFKGRSENVWNIVNNDSPDKERSLQPLTEINATASSVVPICTPQAENKTYTKVETGKKLTNIMKSKQQEKINKELQSKKEADPKRSPSSEFLSLSAIDKALRNLNIDTDTSSVDVVNKMLGYTSHNSIYDEEEDKENSEPTLTKKCHKQSDTMSFTDSILNSTDFKHLQQSISVPREPLSPLSDMSLQPKIKISHAENVVDEEHDADIDEWPSTPIKSPNRRVRRTKSPNSNNTVYLEGVQPLASTDGDEFGENETPVNIKKSIINSRNPTSLSSTRLDGCDALPSSTECDFGVSPNLARRSSATNATLTSRNASPLTSPRSCLSSPLLDSTTNSERHLLMSSVARKTSSSPAGSEASSTSGYTALQRVVNGTQLSAAPRSLSRCSNSSEFSHRDGKLLPLKVTHTSLSWGSTKLRTDVRKSMQIKNTASKRLVVRFDIKGPGFQLVSADCNTITLQSMECRTISINFCPTVCGAAIGALSFYAPLGTNCNQPSMEIPLYGYGGNASITIQGLLKGPVGSSFLTIGDVCDLSSTPLTTSFKFYNKGPLAAYVGIVVDSTVLMKPRLSEAFDVKPSKVIIPPHSEVSVQVIFRPNREDIKNILKKTAQVLTLANMRIFCGDEPNRQRMRALVQRMTSKQREQLTSTMLDNIWCSFPEEQPIRNIATLSEPPEFILDLVTMVRIIDVALTMNRDFDESAETSMLFLPEGDDTVLFRTICSVSSPTPTQSNMLEPVNELLEADTTSAADQHTLEQNWSVQPTCIEFDGIETSAIVFIKNCFKSRQYFEINCNVEDIVRITPRESFVAPDGGQINITVHLLRVPNRDMLRKGIFLIVSMESERISLPINFKSV